MNEHILYKPTEEQMGILHEGEKYVEVWRGLPDLLFVDGTDRCRGGHYSLICEQDGDYVWVTNDAAVALEKDANTILIANMRKKKDKIHAWSVSCNHTIISEKVGEVEVDIRVRGEDGELHTEKKAEPVYERRSETLDEMLERIEDNTFEQIRGRNKLSKKIR